MLCSWWNTFLVFPTILVHSSKALHQKMLWVAAIWSSSSNCVGTLAVPNAYVIIIDRTPSLKFLTFYQLPLRWTSFSVEFDQSWMKVLKQGSWIFIFCSCTISFLLYNRRIICWLDFNSPTTNVTFTIYYTRRIKCAVLVRHTVPTICRSLKPADYIDAKYYCRPIQLLLEVHKDPISDSVPNCTLWIWLPAVFALTTLADKRVLWWNIHNPYPFLKYIKQAISMNIHELPCDRKPF